MDLIRNHFEALKALSRFIHRLLLCRNSLSHLPAMSGYMPSEVYILHVGMLLKMFRNSTKSINRMQRNSPAHPSLNFERAKGMTTAFKKKKNKTQPSLLKVPETLTLPWSSNSQCKPRAAQLTELTN